MTQALYFSGLLSVVGRMTANLQKRHWIWTHTSRVPVSKS